MESFKE
jgi:predicted amino acid dehydrogenase